MHLVDEIQVIRVVLMINTIEKELYTVYDKTYLHYFG